MFNDRRELDVWEKAECAALKAELEALKARGHAFTQESLAGELGLTQGNLSAHLNGNRAINKELAAKISLVTGIAIDQFSPRLAKEIAVMAAANLGGEDIDILQRNSARWTYFAGRLSAMMGVSLEQMSADIDEAMKAEAEKGVKNDLPSM